MRQLFFGNYVLRIRDGQLDLAKCVETLPDGTTRVNAWKVA